MPDPEFDRKSVEVFVTSGIQPLTMACLTQVGLQFVWLAEAPMSLPIKPVVKNGFSSSVDAEIRFNRYEAPYALQLGIGEQLSVNQHRSLITDDARLIWEITVWVNTTLDPKLPLPIRLDARVLLAHHTIYAYGPTRYRQLMKHNK